jgi:hypothetical protein
MYPVLLAHNRVVPDVGIDDDLRAGFLSLFDRLDEMLYRKICDGWDSDVGVKSGIMYDARYDSEDRLEAVKQHRLIGK